MTTISGGRVIYRNQDVCSEQMLDELNKIYGTDEEVLTKVGELAHNLCCDYSYAARLLMGHRNFVKVLQSIKGYAPVKTKGDKFDRQWGVIVNLSDKTTEILKKLEVIE